MRIRRTDTEDATTTEELLAKAMTDDLAAWLRQWLGQTVEIGFNTKADIYHVLMERLRNGVEI